MAFAIGLDVGSTHIKALLLQAGAIGHVVALPNPPTHHSPVGPAYDADTILDLLGQAIRNLCRQAHVNPGEIRRLGLCSMVDSYLLLDKDKKPLTPVIPWYNTAGGALLDRIKQSYDPYELWYRTGQTLHVKRALPRAMLLRELYPTAYKEARYFVSLYAYLLYRISGNLLTDESVACRSMCMDIEQADYMDTVRDDLGSKLKLPAIHHRGEKLMCRSEEQLQAWGLRDNIDIYPAGHDHIAAYSVALNAFSNTDNKPDSKLIFNSLGTAEVYTGPFRLQNRSLDLMQKGFSFGLMASDSYYFLANQPSSGANIEWLRSITGFKDKPYSALVASPDFVAASHDLFFVPFVNGRGCPEPNLESEVAFIGQRENTSVPELAAAIAEALAFESKTILDLIRSELKLDYFNVIAAGGNTLNRHLMESKAALLESGRLFTCTTSELSALGAAIPGFSNQSSANLPLEQVPVHEKLKDSLIQSYPKYQKILDTYKMIRSI
jgi:xylulokinase